MERLRQLIYGIVAGLGIGIGGTVYLSVENGIVGAFLFGIGLLAVCVFSLQLFTGKIGYLVYNKPSYLIELALTWLGNFLGTFIVGIVIKYTRIFPKLSRVNEIVNVKLNDGVLSIFILSIFCGILMFIAVDVYKNAKEGVIKAIGVFLPVVVFILSGFEHCIADMFYVTLANAWSLHAFFYIIVMTIGNSLGGMIIPFSRKYFEKA